MLLEGVSGPFREGSVFRVILPVKTEVEAQLTPSDQLVQKRFGRRRHPPPTFPLSPGGSSEQIREPLLPFRQSVKDLVIRNMPEMKIRGQPAAGLFVGMVMIFGVSIQPESQKTVKRLDRRG